MSEKEHFRKEGDQRDPSWDALSLPEKLGTAVANIGALIGPAISNAAENILRSWEEDPTNETGKHDAGNL